MADLLKDVDDMMRQERLMGLWATYGNYIIGGVLALILGVALNQGVQSWSHARAASDTALLQTALQDSAPAAALAKLAADQGGGNTAARALILSAARDVQAGDTKSAQEKLLTARNDASAAKDLRDLATLQWVRLSMSDKDADAPALQAALKPLMADEGLPFAWAARLEAAVIAGDLQNDPQMAVQMLTPMVDHIGLPASMAERAAALISVYQNKGDAK